MYVGNENENRRIARCSVSYRLEGGIMSGNGSTDNLVPIRTWSNIPVTHLPLSEAEFYYRWPKGIVFAAALTKLLLGPLSVVFAGMALLVDADLARVGGGFWSGAVATAAGAFAMSIRGTRPLPLGFVGWTGLSLGASALLIVLSGTGLAHDVMAARRAWPSAVAVNAILLTIATLDCLASITALAGQLGAIRNQRSLRAYGEDKRRRRLLQWLHSQRHLLQPIFNQTLQKPIQFVQRPQVYTLDSHTARITSPPRL